MGGRPGKIGQTRVPALELKLGMRDILPKPMINAAMGIINFGSSGFQMKPATSPIKVSVKPTSLQNSVRRMAPQAITYHYVGGSFTVKPDSSKSKNNPSTMMAAGDSKKGGLGGWVRGLFGGKGQTVSRDIAYTMYQYFLPTGEVNVYEMRFQGTDDVRVEVEYVSASGEKLPVPSNWQDFVVSRVVTHSSVKPPRFEGLKATRVDDVTDTSPMSRRSEWDEPRVRIPLTEIMTPETGKAAERTLGVSNDLGPIISINGKTYGIGQTLKVGRNQASANVVTPKDDPTVSSQHAEFSVGEGGAVMVRDLESTNGTYVNGMRLRSGGFRMLRDGDVVQMGNQQVLFFEQKNTPNPYDQKAYRAHRPLDVRRDPTNEYRMPTEAEMAKPKPE